MKRFMLGLLAIVAIAPVAFAGTAYSGKEMKQVAAPPPCPEWYKDYEWNINLWGTYIFTANEWRDDRYLETDHAWGGGGDVKYFFMRYFGVGVEGWVTSARQAYQDVFIDFSEGIFDSSVKHENNTIGAVLGTLTLRYPFHCSRFSPYLFGGGGVIFGGGQKTEYVLTTDVEEGEINDQITTHRTGGEAEAIGQFGGGLEIRLTPHIGWTSDFSWNVVDGPQNNFGMVRTGLNFAF